jgi:hypothetical protein
MNILTSLKFLDNRRKMICSPCKDCPRKNLPNEKCVRDCQILRAIQEMDPSLDKLNEGCGIDYTEEYDSNMPPMLSSSSY